MNKAEVIDELMREEHFNQDGRLKREHKPPNFLDYCGQIGETLSSGPAKVMPVLMKLETQLQEAVLRNFKLHTRAREVTSRHAIAHYELKGNLTPEFKHDVQQFKHLLSDVLGTNERNSGFQVNDRSEGHLPVPIYRGQLTREQFIVQPTEGRLFKDLGVSPVHGEHTHRIQWYVVTNMNSGALRGVASALYKTILLQYPGKEGVFVSGLWDYLFDHGSDLLPANQQYFKQESAADFRSPELFNTFLTENEQPRRETPLLASILKARRQKREWQFYTEDDGLENPSFAGMFYLASQKFPGQRHHELTEAQKTETMIEWLSGSKIVTTKNGKARG